MNPDDIVDVESVRCFAAAATHLNFRAAARSIPISPAAFGQRIARLEASLGVQLFHRTTRKVELTSAGERAAIAAERLFASVASFRHAILDPNEPTPFTLTIGTRFELGISWLTPSLTLLAAHRPERTLHLSFGDTVEVQDRVSRGIIDAAVTSSRTIPTEIEYEVLHEEEYVFVGQTAEFQDDPSINPRRARNFVLLEISPDLPLLEYFLRSQRTGQPWRFRRMEYLGTTSAIRLRTLEGAGIAVLPRYFVAEDLQRGDLLELNHSGRMYTDAFRLIWRANHPHRADLTELASELRKIPLR